MNIQWSELIGFGIRDYDLVAPWLMVLESLDDSTHLKIEAEGDWKVEASVVPSCGPDGLPGFTLPGDQLVMARCRYGALIGKLGGSSAAHFTPEKPGAALIADEPFAIGSFCLQKLPSGTRSPLFIGVNSLWRPIRVKTMRLRIFGAMIQEPPGKAPAPKT
jgi:hypothetical protein